VTVTSAHGFEGVVAVVSGAAGGIGAATAELLAGRGARVVGYDVRPIPDAVAEHLALVVRCDLTDQREIVDAIAAAVEEVGPIGVLVHAAGLTCRLQSTAMDPAVWDSVLSVNLTAAFTLAREAFLHRDQRGLAIVNVASQLAFRGVAGRAAYISSKAGLVGLTRSLAVEWAADGVRVNAVAPGVTDTRMIRELQEVPAVVDELTRHIPMRRFADPAEIARPIVFLASNEASYITGTTLVADGGYLCV
jgi:meso-butanediol dehydrogenase/(S,S)-butanediol dehydrogenase/diacetyl reductase